MEDLGAGQGRGRRGRLGTHTRSRGSSCRLWPHCVAAGSIIYPLAEPSPGAAPRPLPPNLPRRPAVAHAGAHVPTLATAWDRRPRDVGAMWARTHWRQADGPADTRQARTHVEAPVPQGHTCHTGLTSTGTRPLRPCTQRRPKEERKAGPGLAPFLGARRGTEQPP